MLEGGLPLATGCGDLGQRVVAGRRPAVVPCRFVKCGVGLLVATEESEGSPELVMRLAIGGVRVAKSQAGNARPQVALSLGKFSPAQVPASERKIAPRITGVAPQRLAPVGGRTTRGVPVLLEVQSGEEKLVRAGDLARGRRLGRCQFFQILLRRRRAGRERTISEQFPAFGGDDAKLKFVAGDAGWNPPCFHEW
jgi:hypothetical protein